MRRFNTLLDAVSHLMRNGYRCDMRPGYQPGDGRTFHFERTSWTAIVRIQKNGRICVESL